MCCGGDLYVCSSLFLEFPRGADSMQGKKVRQNMMDTGFYAKSGGFFKVSPKVF